MAPLGGDIPPRWHLLGTRKKLRLAGFRPQDLSWKPSVPAKFASTRPPPQGRQPVPTAPRSRTAVAHLLETAFRAKRQTSMSNQEYSKQTPALLRLLRGSRLLNED